MKTVTNDSKPTPRARMPAFAVAIMTGFVAAGSPMARGADLHDIYQLALTHDPTYQIATLSYQARQLDLARARASLKPAVTAQVRAGEVRTRTELDEAAAENYASDDHAATLNIRLPLYDRVNQNNVSQSKLQVAIAELQWFDAKQELMVQVAERYFGLLATQDALSVANSEKVAIQRQYDLANARLTVGSGTQTDLFDTRARAKQAEADEISANIAINNARQQLQQMLGTTPMRLERLRAAAPLANPTPNALTRWEARARTDNLAVNISRYQLDIARLEVAKQKSARQPLVELGASYRLSAFDTRTNNAAIPTTSHTQSVNLNLSFPLYVGGSIRAQTRQASLYYEQAKHQLEQQRRLTTAQVTSAFLDVNDGVSQVAALADAVMAGENALNAKEQGFKTGLTTNIDVLDAQRDLSRFRTNYLSARYRYILAVMQLERAVGDLDEADIGRINAWLEVTAPPQ